MTIIFEHFNNEKKWLLSKFCFYRRDVAKHVSSERGLQGKQPIFQKKTVNKIDKRSDGRNVSWEF